MDLKKLLLYVGLPLLGVALVVTTVLVLRAQNQIPQTALIPISISNSTSTVPTASFGGTTGRTKDVVLTPQEQAQRDALAKSMLTAPKDYHQTWTPEFQSQQDAVPTSSRKLSTQ